MLGTDRKALRWAWSFAVVAGLIYGALLVRKTLLAFVIALMLTYLLFPLVEGLHRRLLPKSRVLAAIMPFVAIVATVAAAGVFLAPHVAAERLQLLEVLNSPGFRAKLAGWSPLGLPIGASIPAELPAILKMVPQTVMARVLGATVRDLSNLIIVPILSFFLLRDGSLIRRCVIDMMFFRNEDSVQSRRRRIATERVMADAHLLILDYMRALLLLCLATLVAYGVAFKLMGVPYGLLLALLAFPLEFVPLAGPLASGLIIVGVCGFTQQIARPGVPRVHLVWLIVFLLVYRIFQDYILSPMVMKHGVKLHPLLVIFGVLAGWELGKVGGVFLSIPVLAMARLVYYEWRRYTLARGDVGTQEAVQELSACDPLPSGPILAGADPAGD